MIPCQIVELHQGWETLERFFSCKISELPVLGQGSVEIALEICWWCFSGGDVSWCFRKWEPFKHPLVVEKGLERPKWFSEFLERNPLLLDRNRSPCKNIKDVWQHPCLDSSFQRTLKTKGSCPSDPSEKNIQGNSPNTTLLKLALSGFGGFWGDAFKGFRLKINSRSHKNNFPHGRNIATTSSQTLYLRSFWVRRLQSKEHSTDRASQPTTLFLGYVFGALWESLIL